MSGTILHRRDRTARPPRVEHYSSAVNSHASHAIMNVESLHMAGRLLGHRHAATTNRYAHLDDATLIEAAERIAVAINRKVCRTGL